MNKLHNNILYMYICYIS